MHENYGAPGFTAILQISLMEIVMNIFHAAPEDLRIGFYYIQYYFVVSNITGLKRH